MQLAGPFLTLLQRLELCVIDMSEQRDPVEDVQGRFASRDNLRLPFGCLDGDAESVEHGLHVGDGSDRVERRQRKRET